MALVHRTLTLWPLLGLALVPLAASAAKLNVIGDSGNVASTIDLHTARYDVTQKKVVVTTLAGNVVCPQGQAVVAGQVGLVVDGSTYGVLADPAGAQDQPVHYAPASSEFSLDVIGAATCKSSNVTTAGLKLVFDTGEPLTIGESVYFETATRTFRIRVVEPVLCNSYATAGSGLSVALTEANGVTETLSGFDRLDYEFSAAILRARSGVESTGGRRVQCFSFENPTVAEAAGAAADSIFHARFEFEDVQSDVVVSTTPAQITLLAGGPQSFQYNLVLENVGNGEATGVRAREYLPAVAAGTSISAGAWTCQRFAGGNPTNLGCAVAAGSGILNQPSLTLAPGERIVYTLNRSVVGGSVGTALLLGGAAFVNPTPVGELGRPERNFSDNSSRFAVSLVGNQPPQVSPPLAMNTTEDGTPITIVYSASDAEGDAIQVPIITSSDPGLFTAPLTATGSSPGPWTVVLTPAPNRNGSATITASFTDGNSQPVTVTSSATVTAVNDVPDFTLSSNALSVSACTPGPTCDYIVENFVSGVVAGPADESAQATQLVRSVTNRITCSSAPAGFFGSASAPQVFETAATYRLVVEGIGSVSGVATCEITVREVADNASATTKSFTITYP